MSAASSFSSTSPATAAKPFRISIVRIFWNTMGFYFLGGAVFKLFNDIFIFISPIIMK